MNYWASLDESKRPIEAKIADACAAYETRFGVRPTVALVSEDDNAPAAVAGVTTRAEKRIGRNIVHVGVEAQP
jgi:hypothetical protein